MTSRHARFTVSLATFVAFVGLFTMVNRDLDAATIEEITATIAPAALTGGLIALAAQTLLLILEQWDRPRHPTPRVKSVVGMGVGFATAGFALFPAVAYHWGFSMLAAALLTAMVHTSVLGARVPGWRYGLVLLASFALIGGAASLAGDAADHLHAERSTASSWR